MHYRYFKPELLFDGRKILKDATLIVREDDAIEDISFEVHEDAIPLEGVLAPGFINCHCHLELSHFKGLIPEGTGMTEFLLSVINIRKSGLPYIRQAAEQAEQEMAASGIVAVADICNGTDTLTQKKYSGIYYHNFIETMGLEESLARKTMEKALEYYREFDRLFPGRTSIVPHAPYSVSRELFKLISERKPDLISMHNQESRDEMELFQTGKGDMLKLLNAIGIREFSSGKANSLQFAYPFLEAAGTVILVHNTFADEESIALTNNSKTYWCLCPNANLYINKVLPPVNLFRKQGVKIVVGTDSLASNHQLNMLSELSSIAKEYTEISLEEMLRWITINGAEALGIQEWYGSFEKGKKPGMVNFLVSEVGENMKIFDNS